MKNLKLVLFFGGTLILLLTFQNAMAQSPGEAAPGLFAKIGSWIQNNFLGVLGGSMFAIIPAVRRIWIKKFAHKGAIVMKELGELCFDSSTLLSVLDNSIKEDASLQQNSVPELMAAGKTLFAQMKDVKISITPLK